MTTEWTFEKLGALAKVNYGYTAKASFEKTGPKYLRITDIQNEAVNWSTVPNCALSNEELFKFQLQSGDIVFARTGATTGKSYLVDNPPKAVFASYLIRVQINTKRLLPKYLYLYFQTESYWNIIKKGISGSAQGGFNATKLSELLIPIAPLFKQERIVAIIKEAFAAIAKAQANAEQNLKNGKELFESYLQEVLSKNVDEEKKVRLGDLCTLTRGHNPPKSQFSLHEKKGYIRFYQIRDGWSDEHAVYVPDSNKVHKVSPDEILMVAYRHIGKVYRGVSGAFNVALCKISNRDRSKLNDDYLFYIIPTPIVQGELMKRSERSLIPSMSVEHLKEIMIPLPSLADQKKIVQQLDKLGKESQRLQRLYQLKLDALEELKKSILQKAFRGELITEKEMAI